MTNLYQPQNEAFSIPASISLRDLMEALVMIEARRQAQLPPTPLTQATLAVSISGSTPPIPSTIPTPTTSPATNIPSGPGLTVETDVAPTASVLELNGNILADAAHIDSVDDNILPGSERIAAYKEDDGNKTPADAEATNANLDTPTDTAEGTLLTANNSPTLFSPPPLLPVEDYLQVPEGVDVGAVKWYVVSKGTRVGVFYDWNYVSPLVTKKSGAVYTKASSFSEACVAFRGLYVTPGKIAIIA